MAKSKAKTAGDFSEFIPPFFPLPHTPSPIYTLGCGIVLVLLECCCCGIGCLYIGATFMSSSPSYLPPTPRYPANRNLSIDSELKKVNVFVNLS